MEIIRDESSQLQIPALSVGGKLKGEVEQLKLKVKVMDNKSQEELGKSVADIDLKLQLQIIRP